MPTATDQLVAAGAFALTVVMLAVHHADKREIDPLGVALAAAACLPLLAHRRSPLGAFAVCTAASATINALGYPISVPVGPTIAVFYIASDTRMHERIGVTAAVVGVMFAIHIAATSIGEDSFPTLPIFAGIVVWGGAWIIGDQVRQRRERIAEALERADRAERETERERRLAAAEERTRIARDLHDSAAHAINVILVQAGAARLMQERDPKSVGDALATIEDIARETIVEIEQLISGLRDNRGASDAVEPPAGLAAFETLVERHRAAGLTVRTRIVGRRRALAPGLDQAAYRILQESLTNAARHGSGDADVQVTYGEHDLELTVCNAVEPTTTNGYLARGHGLVGIRERVDLLGGSLELERDANRFLVRARMAYLADGGSA
ncbi:MAG: sensor histidine kinase [Solirubrobacteraceae bacterium]